MSGIKRSRAQSPPPITFPALTLAIATYREFEFSKKEFAYGSGTQMQGFDLEHSLAIEESKYIIVCADVDGNIGSSFTVYP